MTQATPPNLIDPAAAFNTQKLRANRSPVFVFPPCPVTSVSWMYYCYENTGVGLVEFGAEVIREQRGRCSQSHGENIGQRWTGPRQAGLHAGRLPCDLSVLLVSCLAEPLVASHCELINNPPCRSSTSKCEGMAQHAADSGIRPVRSLALSCSHKCQSSPVYYSPCHLSSSSASCFLLSVVRFLAAISA